MKVEERAQLINQYREGITLVEDALQGVSEAELDYQPTPERWTIRQIIHHLADSEITSGIRLRRLLAEESPDIISYDQDYFAIALRYNLRPIESALQLYKWVRTTTLEILEFMDVEQWNRKGNHSEIGEYSATLWLQLYAEHGINHARQIRANREAFERSKR
ncbi:hypothetical protein GTO91_01265 [Heliobacterium undosum]|uniref:DinB-like domain-containing protein n=1 Tax=Heliomicrobium undosum TaxID=121734 RepID=A0A845L1M2_9FIRM|nr:DinB family protein [Heliomicrobium undosum]MZP28350.1 hypothetical protein [Heliomicrobium undosum]